MRFTLLHPDPARGGTLRATDVEADVGVPVSAVRPALARVTGYAGWAGTDVPPAVDDVVLDDHHLVGQPPFVDGCVLRPGAGPPPLAPAAAHAAWHVAVVAGPDCGGVLTVPSGGVATVGSEPAGSALVVRDPTLPRVQVRRRGRRVRLRVGRRGRWRRLRPDRARRVGATTLVLRGAPSERPAVDPPPVDPGRPSVWLAPLVGSVALALVFRQPVLALAGLAMPLVGLGTAAAARVRRRRGPARDARLRDLADLTVATARAVTAPLDPVTLAQPWDPGGSLAVVGPRALALPVARAVVVGALGTHLAATVTVHARHPDPWAWCVWASEGTVPDRLVVVDDPADPAAVARWRAGAPAAHHLLVLAEDARGVPAWCRARLEVGPGAVRLRTAAGAANDVPRQAVSA
ncbi:hypothetical protein, partial [Cellulomonas sp. ICMP 17802]|uniref:hypothetical protein n=1 Tax=Cellulomonas sp. ICMP 17802 TaxID=3239199 RepID=UPI00351B9331